MRTVSYLQTKLLDLRFRGLGMAHRHMHRAMYQIKLQRRNLILSLLLPLVFNLVTLSFLGIILHVWRTTFGFWLERLAPEGSVATYMLDLGHYLLPLPYPSLGAEAPSASIWWITLIASVVLFGASFLITAKRSLPLVYMLRACLLIQASALAYFHFLPGTYPYDTNSFLVDLLAMSLLLLFMIPWILGFTYYIFDFPILQKAALTLLTLLYFTAALPLQYLLHAYALHHLSLLFHPLFYLILGPLLDVMMFVALYSWGMSWRFGSGTSQTNK